MPPAPLNGPFQRFSRSGDAPLPSPILTSTRALAREQASSQAGVTRTAEAPACGERRGGQRDRKERGLRVRERRNWERARCCTRASLSLSHQGHPVVQGPQVRVGGAPPGPTTPTEDDVGGGAGQARRGAGAESGRAGAQRSRRVGGACHEGDHACQRRGVRHCACGGVECVRVCACLSRGQSRACASFCGCAAGERSQKGSARFFECRAREKVRGGPLFPHATPHTTPTITLPPSWPPPAAAAG